MAEAFGLLFGSLAAALRSTPAATVMDPLHSAIASAMDDRAADAPAGSIDGAPDGLEPLALRARFDALMDTDKFDEALRVAKRLQTLEPGEPAHLVRKG